jgi:hypothetical protein
MANRSDFFSSKLPRYYKKMIALGEMAGHYHSAGAKQWRKAFVSAHATHLEFKMKRNVVENRDSSTGE